MQELLNGPPLYAASACRNASSFLASIQAAITLDLTLLSQIPGQGASKALYRSLTGCLGHPARWARRWTVTCNGPSLFRGSFCPRHGAIRTESWFPRKNSEQSPVHPCRCGLGLNYRDFPCPCLESSLGPTERESETQRTAQSCPLNSGLQCRAWCCKALRKQERPRLPSPAPKSPGASPRAAYPAMQTSRLSCMRGWGCINQELADNGNGGGPDSGNNGDRTQLLRTDADGWVTGPRQVRDGIM